jgi:hypothetical protein
MKKSVVAFAYEKTDGSLRRAKGTLADVASTIKGTGAENYKTVRYYDIDAKGWRSFRAENLIAIY